MFGDEAVLRYLAICEKNFASGSRLALFETIEICARFQAVIPEWASDAILEGWKALESGECESFDDFFLGAGNHLKNSRARKKEALIKKNATDVIGLLTKHRCDGGTFNAEDAFQTVADETGVPRRIVGEIYKRHGVGVKKIPQGNPDGVNYVIAFGELPMPRRKGRSIL